MSKCSTSKKSSRARKTLKTPSQKKGRAARDKGARGEREWRDFSIEQGCTGVKRTQQFCGKGGDSADVMNESLPSFHQEVKRVEALCIQPAIAQAVADAKPGKLPIVAFKQSNKEWLVIMRAEDWFKLALKYEYLGELAKVPDSTEPKAATYHQVTGYINDTKVEVDPLLEVVRQEKVVKARQHIADYGSDGFDEYGFPDECWIDPLND